MATPQTCETAEDEGKGMYYTRYGDTSPKNQDDAIIKGKHAKKANWQTVVCTTTTTTTTTTSQEKNPRECSRAMRHKSFLLSFLSLTIDMFMLVSFRLVRAIPDSDSVNWTRSYFSHDLTCARWHHISRGS